MLPPCLSAHFHQLRITVTASHNDEWDSFPCVRTANSFASHRIWLFCGYCLCFLCKCWNCTMNVKGLSSFSQARDFFFFLIYSDACDNVYPCSELKFGCRFYALIIALAILHCRYLKLTFPRPNSLHCWCPSFFFFFFLMYILTENTWHWKD